MENLFRKVLAENKPLKTGHYIFQWIDKNEKQEPIRKISNAWYFCEPVGMNDIGWATDVEKEMEWWLEPIEIPSDQQIAIDYNTLRGSNSAYGGLIDLIKYIRKYVLAV